jgi:hypothetical protein
MATAKSPFKNAAAAIYAVCVTKEYPPLPPDMSEDAVTFLSRYIDTVGYFSIIIGCGMYETTG